nr:hypothetical protein [Tanacetum cinerariifolium]
MEMESQSLVASVKAQRGEHAAQISTPYWKCYIFYDDNDEYTIQYREYLENSSNAIAPKEPDNSLSMGDEHLSTILETKSNEVIKSSVEDLVPIPSETEDTSGSYKDIEFKDSYDSNINESTFLVTPLFDSNEDEYFTPGDDVELLLHRDLSTPIMSVVSILEGFTDEPPLEENGDLFDLESKKNDWKKILYDTPTDDLMTAEKVFNLGIHDQIFFSNICELTL